MALLLSGAVGALGMTDASMKQTGREIKCLPAHDKKKKSPETGSRGKKSSFTNSFMKLISLVWCQHFPGFT